ncbi:helix-turn-helix domain containing protein [Aliiroseovarius sp. KMU-50]|uniref:Helix-turn-helix domain containing protein n=1 Tax=Aliiroseovarius salicola TaxID=3009082 RepID=A0ABT4W1R4_9RHOB|nr:TetR/AcrR family transcriptional regulator [Aliiroseovarius sp. KMU-50]MDA5094454.1 helix-turn-helix domain containing protein [Aliiroseovarius sp. KMU-50]
MSIFMAAIEVFQLYGFRRSSMEDIATAAGMSRAALYLHFKNKQDLFRRLVTMFFAQAVLDLSAELTRDPERPVAETLTAALLAKGGAGMEALFNSPHGHELMEVKDSAAQAEVADGMALVSEVLANWFEAQANAGRVTLELSASDLAKTLLHGLDGVKINATTYQGYRDGITRMSRVFGKSISV